MEERGVRREQEVKGGKGESEDGEARNRMEVGGREGEEEESGERREEEG